MRMPGMVRLLVCLYVCLFITDVMSVVAPLIPQDALGTPWPEAVVLAAACAAVVSLACSRPVVLSTSYRFPPPYC